MTTRSWLLVAVAVYLVILWVVHKFRRASTRRRGLPPEKLSTFDHRGFLDELREIYLAGLPTAKGAEQEEPPARGERAKGPLSSRLGAPPPWFEPKAWSAERAGKLPEQLRSARELVASGREKEVEEIVDPAQEPSVDQRFASLGIHFFLERLYAGDLDGAGSILDKLPIWTRQRIGGRVAEKHLAHLALLRSEAGAEGRRWLREARKLIKQAGGGGKYADTGTLALWAHLTLTHGRWFIVEEAILMRVDYSLRRGLSETRSSSLLYYELAHCCLWRAKREEAVEHLARALYFSAGDSFYARPVLQWPELARLKPALVKQARARVEAGDSAGDLRAN